MLEFLQNHWHCSTAIHICNTPGKWKKYQAWMWQVRRHTLHFLAFDHCSEEKTIRSDSDAGVSIEALLALLNCISHLQHTRQTENEQVRSMLKELTICCSQGQCDISDQAEFTKNQRLAGQQLASSFSTSINAMLMPLVTTSDNTVKVRGNSLPV